MRRVALVVLALAVSLVLAAVAAPAKAAEPYGGYDEAAQPGNRVVRILGVPVRACKYEDGSGGPLPCRWDARRMGNGVGKSYWIDRNERTHHVKQARMNRVHKRIVGR